MFLLALYHTCASGPALQKRFEQGWLSEIVRVSALMCPHSCVHIHLGLQVVLAPAATHAYFLSRIWMGHLVCQASDVDDVIARIKAARARADPRGVSIGYHGNVVTLWEALAKEEELLVDLGSDQTSLHNPFGGGYYPVQLSFEEAQVCDCLDDSVLHKALLPVFPQPLPLSPALPLSLSARPFAVQPQHY